MDTGIEVEPDTLNGELNLSLLPADKPGPPNSPLPLTPNPGHADPPLSMQRPEGPPSIF